MMAADVTNIERRRIINPKITILCSRSENVSLPHREFQRWRGHGARSTDLPDDGLPDAVLRFVGATLHWGFNARTREQNEDRDRVGPLDVATMRDIGACRGYQD